MKDKESFAKIEKLFNEISANQQSVYDMVSALYERMDKLEKSLSNNIVEWAEEVQALSREEQIDTLYEPARFVIAQAGKASTSYLQRKLRIGYSLAAALMDKLEEEGDIGPQDGAKPREVFITPEDCDEPDEEGNDESPFVKFTKEDLEGEEDELYEDAKQAVIEAGKASTSYLQRRLRVGYSRAARLMDLLEDGGVIGPADGAKPREILIDPDDEDQ